MNKKREIGIALIEYPGAMMSSVLGLVDMFELANRIASQYSEVELPVFAVHRWPAEQLQAEPDKSGFVPQPREHCMDAVIVPPAIHGNYYLAPERSMVDWLKHQHANGTVLCSACAGSFILAATGLLKVRPATTHWNLSGAFAQAYPEVLMDTDRVLINDGDMVTAGGLMSWMDLGLEIVAQFTRPSVMQELGKILVIDTGRREQRYYKSFVPQYGHGDAAIIKAQHYIQQYFQMQLTVSMIAEHCHLGERTLLRKFLSVTGMTPSGYLQNIRIQKARELIETTGLSIEIIASKVGYQDTGAFRAIFKRLTGLSPREFRIRFSV